jgi:hypothetical protein
MEDGDAVAFLQVWSLRETEETKVARSVLCIACLSCFILLPCFTFLLAIDGVGASSSLVAACENDLSDCHVIRDVECNAQNEL